MSKESTTIKVLRKHAVGYTSYSVANWGSYWVFCECGEEFSDSTFEGAKDLHLKHTYGKLKKALKKRKKKKTAVSETKIVNGATTTTYYHQGANFGD